MSKLVPVVESASDHRYHRKDDQRCYAVNRGVVEQNPITDEVRVYGVDLEEFFADPNHDPCPNCFPEVETPPER